MSNQPSLEDIAAMTPRDLHDYRGEIESGIKEAVREATTILSECDRVTNDRLSDVVESTYQLNNKKHGKLTLPLPDGLTVTANISKKVTWDQEKLRALAATMDWQNVSHFFKIDFSVTEKIFGALAPDSDMQKAMSDARTVEYGDPKIAMSFADPDPDPAPSIIK